MTKPINVWSRYLIGGVVAVCVVVCVWKWNEARNLKVALEKARVELSGGRSLEAIESLREYINPSQFSFDEASELVLEALLKRAAQLGEAGDIAGARSALDRAARYAPHDQGHLSVLETSGRSLDLLDAKAAFKEGRFKDAAALFGRVGATASQLEALMTGKLWLSAAELIESEHLKVSDKDRIFLEAGKECVLAEEPAKAIDYFKKSGLLTDAVEFLLTTNKKRLAIVIASGVGDSRYKAELAEKVGDLELARTLYTAAGEWIKLARVLSLLGQHNSAGKLMATNSKWEQAADYYEKGALWLDAYQCWDKAGRADRCEKIEEKVFQAALESYDESLCAKIYLKKTSSDTHSRLNNILLDWMNARAVSADPFELRDRASMLALLHHYEEAADLYKRLGDTPSTLALWTQLGRQDKVAEVTLDLFKEALAEGRILLAVGYYRKLRDEKYREALFAALMEASVQEPGFGRVVDFLKEIGDWERLSSLFQSRREWIAAALCVEQLSNKTEAGQAMLALGKLSGDPRLMLEGLHLSPKSEPPQGREVLLKEVLEMARKKEDSELICAVHFVSGALDRGRREVLDLAELWSKTPAGRLRARNTLALLVGGNIIPKMSIDKQEGELIDRWNRIGQKIATYPEAELKVENCVLTNMGEDGKGRHFSHALVDARIRNTGSHAFRKVVLRLRLRGLSSMVESGSLINIQPYLSDSSAIRDALMGWIGVHTIVITDLGPGEDRRISSKISSLLPFKEYRIFIQEVE